MNGGDQNDSWQKMIGMKLKQMRGDRKQEGVDSPRKKHSQNKRDYEEGDRCTKDELVKIKTYVNSEGTITIRPSSKRLSLLLSKIDGTVYDVNNNEWRINGKDYVNVAKKLKENNFTFDGIPKGTLNVVQKQLNSGNFELVGSIYNVLFPFQREGVVYALNRNGRILLADDMGLGKTVQALAVVYYYYSEWPLLIIAPASLLESWGDACKTFLHKEANIVRGKDDAWSEINIVSYEIASNNASMIHDIGIKVIIADECHYLKGLNTKRTKLIVPLLQNASRVLLLSGTPAVSRPVELYPIISAMDKEIFPHFTEYGNRYCNGRKIGQWYDYKGCSNAEELYYILRKYFMLRRTKEEVLNQLPPKSRRQIILQVDRSQVDVTQESIGESVGASITVQYREAVALKMDPVKQYLLTMIERNVKFIVFCHHTEMMDALEEFFGENNVCMIKIDGSTPGPSRGLLVKEYQEKDEVRVALLSITACSSGLTLTAGRAVVFAELYWNPGTLLQAEDRVHRIGQKKSVDIIYLVARGTVDEYVWPKLLSKLNVLESLGLGSNQLRDVDVIPQAGQKTLHQFNIK